MSKILFEKEITNDITYEGVTKERERDNYSKTYTLKKWFFGIRFHNHVFRETINTKVIDENKGKVGFKNEY